jgi:adenine/guanine/hypoxanthine permease
MLVPFHILYGTMRQVQAKMKQLLDSFFHISQSGSTVRTEVIAGITTFLTVIYIVPLNGIIMSQAGMPMGAVITSTAIVTAVATIATGLWANTPIAMSVGLGLNSYVVFALVQGQKVPWQTALGLVFISGIFFLILTVTKVRRYIIDALSAELRISISAGIGLFIAFIGLKNMGIITSHPVTLVTLGDLASPVVLLGIGGLFLIASLAALKVKGAFILAIAITSIIGYITGVAVLPQGVISLPQSPGPLLFGLDIAGAFKVVFIAPMVTLMLTDLFDSLGTLAGVGYRAGIFDKSDSTAVQKTLEVDAAASVFGACMGVTTTTSFIESAAGVEEGGRTGLTSLVTGLLFLLTLFFLPLFKSIPPNAIYPVLVIVGVLMFADIHQVNFGELEIGLPAFFIIVMMPLTFSITRGLAAGLIAYVFIRLVKRKWSDLTPVTIILALVSILAFIVE